ncbi:MAG: hypothetical protein IJF32_02325 [Oscillospiraceae bacterium]|nr:hypothetical protein [Oscillospiraceae bacterium]
MKRTICNIEYDTENSELILKHTSGNPGDPDGYEESLYKTPEGKYFLYVNGGENSIHPTENITRMSEKTAESWMSEHR